MALNDTLAATIFAGNASTSTPYPVAFRYLDAADVNVSVNAQGTGTVTVTAGAAVFASAQSAIDVGDRIRIGGVNYEIATRTSDTVFAFRQRVTIAASAFHRIESAVTLTPAEFSLASDGVRTLVAVVATSLVTVWRNTPVVQLTTLPLAGSLPASALEEMADRAAMIGQELASRLDGTGVGIAPAATGTLLQDVASWADATERGLTAPLRVGQLGVQLNDNTLWVGTGLLVGNWTLSSSGAARTFATNAELLAATPLFIGEIVSCREDSSLWVGLTVAVGSWNLAWAAHPGVWERQPWRWDEPIRKSDSRRWAGCLSRRFVIESGKVCCAQPGLGSLTIKVHFVSAGVQLTTAPIVITGYSWKLIQAADITASVKGALANGVWTGGVGVDAGGGEAVWVEVVSVGVSADLTTTVGSGVSTPSGGDFTAALTGATLAVTGQAGDIFVIASRLGGTAELSHTINSTGTLTTNSTPRAFTLGVIGLGLAAGATVVPCSATECALVRVGATVIGSTVQPGTVVQTVTPGTPSFTLSLPVTGATTRLAVVETARPAQHRFVGLTALAGAVTATLPHTTGLSLGDTITGLNVAAGTYISVAPSGTSITFTPALSGNIGELFIGPPVRTGTAAAGASVVVLSNAVGLKIGQRVSSAAGVPDDAYVTAVAAPNVTLSQPLEQAIVAESLTFTSDVVRVTGDYLIGDTGITLPYAVSATPIVVGSLVTGDGVPSGTFVQSVAGSTVTVQNEFGLTATGVALTFTANPEWKGLELAINGHYISATPPR
jgi:hypothetical protein